jgi:ribosomal protein L37E
MQLTYHIDNNPVNGYQFIKCLLCGVKSYSVNDIYNKYCVKCDIFYEEEMARRSTPLNLSKPTKTG